MNTERPTSAPPAVTDAAADWLQLSPRTVAANMVTLGVHLGLPMVVVSIVVSYSADPRYGLGILAATVVILSAIAGIDWFWVSRTRYRVTEERFEFQAGIVSRQYRALPRDRIRSVDLSADMVCRMFGLSKVTISTGESATTAQHDALKLEFVAAPAAETLRRTLLWLDDPRAGPDAQATPANVVLAQLNWRWFRYAPLTVWTPMIGLGALGGLYQLLSWFGEERANAIMVRLYDLARSQGWSGIVSGILVVVLVGIVTTLAVAVEAWWGYRLEREGDQTLRLQRGLLNARVISVDEQRLRGVEVAEPLVLRWIGAAQVSAIATGLGATEEDEPVQKSALTPDVPKGEAQRVAAVVLREPYAPMERAVFISHPRAALRRRLVRAFSAVAAIGVVPAVLLQQFTWMPTWIWMVPLMVLAVAPLYAIDAYRNLGHGFAGPYLLIRSGTFTRRTVALRRESIIGWTVRQSPFQRRSGLATLTATTAAGRGAYHIRDVATGEGLIFAEQARPSLYLVHRTTEGSARGD